MAGPFIEDYVPVEGKPGDGPRLDPLAPAEASFDWDAVYEALGEGDHSEDVMAEARRISAFAVRELLAWQVRPYVNAPVAGNVPGITRRSQRARILVVARRTLALAWALDLRLIDSSPSLSAMARSLGVDKMSLSRHAADARRRFRLVNRSSAHGWSFRQDKPT